MPPKARYTKSEISSTAFEMLRKHGRGILTARSIAAELGCSTAPIFTAFQSLEELENSVRQQALQCYESYLAAGLAQQPPFKGAGLEYIRFAKEEPHLFRYLFMQEDGCPEPTHFLPAYDPGADEVQKALEQSWSLPSRQAADLYNHLSVYVYGLAVLFSCGNCVFTMEDVSRMLSEVFLALMKGVEE